MDELITEVTIIRWLLVAILTLVCATAYFVISTLRNVDGVVSDEAVESEKFKNQAEVYENQGSCKALLALCEQRLERFENDKLALYYIGIASLRLEDYTASKSYFNRLKSLDPKWNDTVVAYLDEINRHISKNKPKPIQISPAKV